MSFEAKKSIIFFQSSRNEKSEIILNEYSLTLRRLEFIYSKIFIYVSKMNILSEAEEFDVSVIMT